jgi:hypothetical protein
MLAKTEFDKTDVVELRVCPISPKNPLFSRIYGVETRLMGQTLTAGGFGRSPPGSNSDLDSPSARSQRDTGGYQESLKNV